MNIDKCRPDVADGVISGMAVEKVGLDVLAKFDDSRSSHLEIFAPLICDERPTVQRRTTSPADAGHHIRQNAILQKKIEFSISQFLYENCRKILLLYLLYQTSYEAVDRVTPPYLLNLYLK